MERTPGASSSLCVRAKNRQILVRGERYGNRSHMAQCTFAVPSTHMRIWFVNHSAHLCIRGLRNFEVKYSENSKSKICTKLTENDENILGKL